MPTFKCGFLVFSIFVDVALSMPAHGAAAETRRIDFIVVRQDPDGTQGWEGITIEPDDQELRCDESTGMGGKGSCWLTCNQPMPQRQNMYIGFPERSDFDRRPAKISVVLKNCEIEVAPTQITYVHYRVLQASAEEQFNNLIAREPRLARLAADGSSRSSQILEAMASLLTEPANLETITEFRSIATDLSTIHLKLRNNEVAAGFSRYATTVAVAMVWDIQSKYGERVLAADKDPGSLTTYYTALKELKKTVEVTPTGNVNAPAFVRNLTARRAENLTTARLDTQSFRSVEVMWSTNSDAYQ